MRPTHTFRLLKRTGVALVLATAMASSSAGFRPASLHDLAGGAIVPPAEPIPSHALLDADLAVAGEIVEWIGLSPTLPTTKEYDDYVEARFAGFETRPTPEHWGFAVGRIRVDKVLASADGVDVQEASIVTVYLPHELLWNQSDVGLRVVAFLDAYVHSDGGVVPPYSPRNTSFVLPERTMQGSIIVEETAAGPCPGAARDYWWAGYYLSLTTTKESNAALQARFPGLTPGDRGVFMWNGTLSDGYGAPTIVSRRKVDAAGLSCEDLLTFDELPTRVPGR